MFFEKIEIHFIHSKESLEVRNDSDGKIEKYFFQRKDFIVKFPVLEKNELHSRKCSFQKKKVKKQLILREIHFF